MNSHDEPPSLAEKLHAETARIPWVELQRFFAKGLVLRVADELDLIAVAVMFANDQSDELKPLLSAGTVAAPSDELAREWVDSRAQLWSVVVAPFVLVQCAREPDK